MTTIRLGTERDDAAFREAVQLILHHKGKVLLGPSPKSRTEVTKSRAIHELNSRESLRERANLYLVPAPKQRSQTQQQKWNEACKAAREGVQTMRAIQTRTEEWAERLGETGSQNLLNKLDRVNRLDLEHIQQTLDDAETIELPKGYGRDG